MYRSSYPLNPNLQKIHLHDIGLVNASDLLAIILDGVIEREFRYAMDIAPGNDLQTFHDSWDGLKKIPHCD